MPASKSYKLHLMERLQTTEEQEAYLKAAKEEGEDVYALALQDVADVAGARQDKIMENQRYVVYPPAGQCGSGFFSFWVIRDTAPGQNVGGVGSPGNNIVDYYSDCMIGAAKAAIKRAGQYNSGEVVPDWWGTSHGEPV